jgi:hypothetical protein
VTCHVGAQRVDRCIIPAGHVGKHILDGPAGVDAFGAVNPWQKIFHGLPCSIKAA